MLSCTFILLSHESCTLQRQHVLISHAFGCGRLNSRSLVSFHSRTEVWHIVWVNECMHDIAFIIFFAYCVHPISLQSPFYCVHPINLQSPFYCVHQIILQSPFYCVHPISLQSPFYCALLLFSSRLLYTPCSSQV